MPGPTLISLSVLFARLMWMIFGPLTLVLLLSGIAQPSEASWRAADIGFFGIIAVMVGSRCYEFATGQALTATGEPMTKAALIRYASALAIIGLTVWCGVKMFLSRSFG